MQYGWNHNDLFDMCCRRETFPAFVQAVLENYPGWVSRGYAGHVVRDDIDFVGKCEYLADDLISALRQAGEEFDEAIVRSVPKVNQISTLPLWDKLCGFTTELAVLVSESEHDAIRRFGYAEVPLLPITSSELLARVST